MGWKANCILLSERGDAVFSKFPPHQPARALELLEQFGFDNRKLEAKSDFNETVYLVGNRLGIGAYNGGLIICGAEIDLPEKGSTLQLIQSLIRVYPSATIIELGLHSVVNFFHYKVWKEGTLVRHYAGSADDGVVANEGPLLPVEEPHFKNSELRDGERTFFIERNGERREFDASAYGESLLFAVAGTLLGESLDAYKGENLEIEVFSKKFSLIPSAWWKLWATKPARK